MTSNPYAVPAFIAVAAVLLGCGAWVFLAATRQPAAGKHAMRRDPGAEAARFAAELRGEPEPREEQPVRQQPGDPREPGEADWWDTHAPPPAVEILTGPGAPSPQTSATVIGVLAQARDAIPPVPAPPPPLDVRQPRAVDVPRWEGGPDRARLARARDALLPDAWRPEPGEAAFTPADPDATLTDLRPVEASQYLAAPQ